MRHVQLSYLLLVAYFVSGFVSAADDWWEYAHFYQIYPRSFHDSDGDGIGDLNGITSKLSHLKNISVDGVWLSPIFESPQRDMGYDISDFKTIHNEFGTMDDFDRLVARCQELDIKLILDFVPNHSSDQHEWFKKSANPNHPEHDKYKDYYVWNKGRLLPNGTRVPPSNWLSIFQGSAWTWVNSRQSYYLHQFLKEQPDLNFRNPEVMREMKDVLRFWLRKGVSGFRIDAVPHMFEVKENADGVFDDEPLSGICKHRPQADCYLKHTKTQYLDETYDLIYQWRSVIDEPEFNNHSRILMNEAYGSVPQMVKCYGNSSEDGQFRHGAQIPFNFLIMFLGHWSKSSDFIGSIKAWIDNMPKADKIQANWVGGNHDQPRLATRFGPKRADIFNILIKTLPGIAITYNGEEIAMTNVDEVRHIDYRFPARTPMQWDNTTNAGFTNSTPWLPVAKNYTQCNVELQSSQDISHLKVFKQLISLRQNPTLKYGELNIQSAFDDKLLTYKREIKDDPNADVIVVVLNLSNGSKISNIDLDALLNGVPNEMKIIISSIHSNSNGRVINTKDFTLDAYTGVVLIGRRQ